VAVWPCKYLGLPLGLRKPTAAQLQPVVDSAANRLQPWCAKLLTRGGGLSWSRRPSLLSLCIQ
jgi:hypothetical protein